MGLIVYVYKNDGPLGDCSNDGVSSNNGTLCLTNVDGPFLPSDDCPAARLIKGHQRNTAMIVPTHLLGKTRMFGGAYASTCDSRFTYAVENITKSNFYGAIPIHDRVE